MKNKTRVIEEILIRHYSEDLKRIDNLIELMIKNNHTSLHIDFPFDWGNEKSKEEAEQKRSIFFDYLKYLGFSVIMYSAPSRIVLSIYEQHN